MKNRIATENMIQLLDLKLKVLSNNPNICVEVANIYNLKRTYHRLIVKNFIFLYTVDYFSKKVFISYAILGRSNYLFQ